MTRPSLNYQLKGEGPTLVLLHGLFGSLDNLGMVSRGLSEQYQVLSIDLPDHGRSPHSDGFAYQDSVSAVLALLDELNMPKVAILGHSMGGKVAMRLALQHPERVSQLLVADIAPVHYEPRHQNVFAGLQAVDLTRIESRNDAEAAMAQHIEMPGVRQFLLRSLYKNDAGAYAWRFNLPLLIRDYSALSAGIAFSGQYLGPVLFIKGGDSDYILPEHQSVIAPLFPNAKAKIIQGTGHWLHAEKPQIFNKIVADFLAKHPSH